MGATDRSATCSERFGAWRQKRNALAAITAGTAMGFRFYTTAPSRVEDPNPRSAGARSSYFDARHRNSLAGRSLAAGLTMGLSLAASQHAGQIVVNIVTTKWTANGSTPSPSKRRLTTKRTCDESEQQPGPHRERRGDHRPGGCLRGSYDSERPTADPTTVLAAHACERFDEDFDPQGAGVSTDGDEYAAYKDLIIADTLDWVEDSYDLGIDREQLEKMFQDVCDRVL